jgi:hypothetical protein
VEHEKAQVIRKLQEVQSTHLILSQHCDALESQRVKQVLAPMPTALFGHSAEWEPVDTSLPCRCSHHAAVLNVKDCDVMVVIGGISNAEWHESTLVVIGLDAILTGSSKTLGHAVHVFQATSNSSLALPRRECAACAISKDRVLVLGGLVQDRECMDMWVGQLSSHNGVSHGFPFPMIV